jgi:UrcA family protein
MIILASKLSAHAARAGLTAAIVLLGSASFTATSAAAPGVVPDAVVPDVDASPANGPKVVVHFGDLNLGTDAGALALYRRIVAAAAQVCPAWDPNNLGSIGAGAACRKTVIAHAVAAIPSERLAAVRAAHDKRG